eukprot:CAMPEP_0180229990 /NCGR_PEP_ID=MMETSP0987-20121128/25896_1 /TAXON_ID=697907 /ORGANISM="non described non described, Strain CCMP2293" /LENGTH=43 /DNA_ID= /DNA_START= /DNA_END= /DNA_ORIENTATION=
MAREWLQGRQSWAPTAGRRRTAARRTEEDHPLGRAAAEPDPRR